MLAASVAERNKSIKENLVRIAQRIRPERL